MGYRDATDGFGLEQPDRGLGQCVVVVADTADGCREPFQYKGFRERNRSIMRPGIAVMNQSARHSAVGVIAPPPTPIKKARRRDAPTGSGQRLCVDAQAHRRPLYPASGNHLQR
jgi:hypothetical protein